MRYLINLDLSIDGNRTSQANEFYCTKGGLVSKVHSWIREIKMETGYRVIIIERVLVNDEFDISESVRKFKVETDDSWIPF